MQPGAVTETVNVAGRAMLLQTDSAEVSHTFEPKQITELPLATRSPQTLVGLMPGVTPPTQDFTALEDPQGTTFFRANGQANSANNTQVDGVDNTNPTLGLTIHLPSAEVVQDVQIVTSNYNAEYGRAGGAIINMVSRSGTNELHGALYHFHRNTALRARNFFNTTNLPKPNFIRNQFGGTLGGPIWKDKTFCFGSFQGMFLRQATTQTTSVPVEAWRNGDFSGVPGLSLYDPATGTPDGTGRHAFAENRIPEGRIHPISRKLISLIPRPNLPGLTNNLVANVGFSQNSYIHDGRIGHNFSDATRIFGKFNLSDYKVIQGAALGDVIGEATRGYNYTTTSTINLTHAFNPKLLTEVRLGYNRYYVDVAGINRDPLSAQLGIRILNPSPESAFGLTRVQVSGMQGMGGYGSQTSGSLEKRRQYLQHSKQLEYVLGTASSQVGRRCSAYSRGPPHLCRSHFLERARPVRFQPRCNGLAGWTGSWTLRDLRQLFRVSAAGARQRSRALGGCSYTVGPSESVLHILP